jgi:hypothetical protein
MGRKLGGLPMFLVFNSGIESVENSSVFTFFLLLFAFYRFLYLPFELFTMSLVMFSCLFFR